MLKYRGCSQWYAGFISSCQDRYSSPRPRSCWYYLNLGYVLLNTTFSFRFWGGIKALRGFLLIWFFTFFNKNCHFIRIFSFHIRWHKHTSLRTYTWHPEAKQRFVDHTELFGAGIASATRSAEPGYPAPCWPSVKDISVLRKKKTRYLLPIK